MSLGRGQVSVVRTELRKDQVSVVRTEFMKVSGQWSED